MHPRIPPPPSAFHPAQDVQYAEFTNAPALRQRRYTGRRLQGIKYERKVQEYLRHLYGDMHLASPWLKFLSGGKWRWCQPDALVWLPEEGRVVLVEVKYQHTTDAWWQTKHLYQPVLRSIFPEALWTIEFCEIVKWFDPSIVFPERIVLASDVTMESSAFKVHIYKP